MGRRGRGCEHRKKRSFFCTEEKMMSALDRDRRDLSFWILIGTIYSHSQEEVMNYPAANHQGVGEMFYRHV